jgi:hypothetical protein
LCRPKGEHYFQVIDFASLLNLAALDRPASILSQDIGRCRCSPDGEVDKHVQLSVPRPISSAAASSSG